METVYVDKHYQLVAECRQGNRKAYHELYRLYAKAMLNAAFRVVGNIAEAEDAVQDAFVDAFKRIQDFRQETTFGLWLKQIVIHRAINVLRKRKMVWTELQDDQLENLPNEETEDNEELHYKAALIKEAMNELPDGYRVVISLYLLEGYDHEEIGQVLNISENTSRTQFLRAKRKLVEILRRKGITG